MQETKTLLLKYKNVSRILQLNYKLSRENQDKKIRTMTFFARNITVVIAFMLFSL